MATLKSRIEALEHQGIGRAPQALIIMIRRDENLTSNQEAEIKNAERARRPCIVLRTSADSGKNNLQFQPQPAINPPDSQPQT